MMPNKRKKTEMIIFIPAGAAVLALLLAYLIRREYELPYLCVIMILSAAAVCLHAKRAFAEDGRGLMAYAADLTGVKTPSANRIHEFDHLRFLALCGVIITHAVQVDLEGYTGGGARAAGALWVVTMSANVVYVMLSGALLYRPKEQKLAAFYLRRIEEVVIPLIVYYMWYLAVNYHLGRGWNWVSIRSVPAWLLTNRMKEAPHLWLVYVILSLYLTVPFFRLALAQFPYRRLTEILLFLFVFSAAVPLINRFLVHDQLAVRIPFTGWLLVSLYGYWVSQEESRRFDRLTIPAGLAAMAAIAAIAAGNPSEDIINTWCLNDASLPAVFCTGLFAVVFHFGSRSHPKGEKTGHTGVFGRSNPVLRCICRYSYGIMLIHWYTLHFIVIDRLHVHAFAAGGFGVLLSAVLTLVFSWIICFIIDNLLVFPLKALWNLIWRRLL